MVLVNNGKLPGFSGGYLLVARRESKHREEQTWSQFSKKMIDVIHASNGKIHFDLTHVKDVRSVLDNRGQYRDKITSHERRYLKQNWKKFENNVSFYKNGKKVPAPW